jgi:hypothetical protein
LRKGQSRALLTYYFHAARLDLNAPAKWEWKDFKTTVALLVAMIYSIVRGLEAYSRFEIWGKTTAYHKAAMVAGALLVAGMPFVGYLAVYLYFNLRRKEKNM